MKDFDDLRIGQQRLQVRRVGVILRDLDDVGGAVATRHLHHAEPVAMRIEPHGFGIDRNRILVAGEIRQVAAMQADGHGAGNLIESVTPKVTLKSPTNEGRGPSLSRHAKNCENNPMQSRKLGLASSERARSGGSVLGIRNSPSRGSNDLVSCSSNSESPPFPATMTDLGT